VEGELSDVGGELPDVAGELPDVTGDIGPCFVFFERIARVIFVLCIRKAKNPPSKDPQKSANYKTTRWALSYKRNYKPYKLPKING